jgi:hypothetical protein
MEVTTTPTAAPKGPNPMLILGGVGCIIWLVGAILAVIIGGIGYIVLGIGVLLTSFAGFGLWQMTKEFMPIFMFVMALVGGILLLVGGALWAARVGGNAGPYVTAGGQMLFGISLITLGLIINKLQSQLSTQASLGMDLVFPAVITAIAGGCAVLGALVTVTAPAAVILMILFFVTK